MSLQITEADYRINQEPIQSVTPECVGRTGFYLILKDQTSGDRVLSDDTSQFAFDAALGYVSSFPDNISFLTDYRKKVQPSIQALTPIVGDEDKVIEMASTMPRGAADFLIAVHIADEAPQIKQTITSRDQIPATDDEIISLRESLLNGNVSNELHSSTQKAIHSEVIFVENDHIKDKQKQTPEQVALKIRQTLEQAGLQGEVTLARLIRSLPGLKADLLRVHTSHSGKYGKTTFSLFEIEDACIRKWSKGLNPKTIRDLLDKKRKGGENK